MPGHADLAAEDDAFLTDLKACNAPPKLSNHPQAITAQNVRQRRLGGILLLGQVPVGRIERGESHLQ